MALRSRFSSLFLFLLILPTTCSAVDISGVVLDTNNTPLAGVRVAAGEPKPVQHLANLIETTTDAQGRFTIKGVAESGDIDFIPVEAYAPGRTTGSAIFTPKDPKELKLKLAKARPITIQLLDLQGKPAAGVLIVQAECKFPSLWGLLLKTDKDGKVTFPAAPEGGVYLLCISDTACVHSDIQVRSPEDDGAKFKIVPGATVEGKLLDPKGKPLTGVKVMAAIDGLGFWGGYGTVITDAAGEFSIARLDGGDCFVSIDPTSAYAFAPIKCKTVRGKVTQLSTIRAKVPGIITGRIVNHETGKPIEKMQVYYTPAVWPSNWAGHHVYSDKDGNYKIYGIGTVSAMPYIWSHPEYPQDANRLNYQDLNMESGKVTTYNIRLRTTLPPQSEAEANQFLPTTEPVESLRVLVLDQQDRPVSGCKLRLLGYNWQEQVLQKDVLANAETDQQGSASVPTPKGDAFVWVASKPGYTDAWNATTCFVPDPVILRLFKATPIKGQLVNELGKAVPNATITAKAVSGSFYSGQTIIPARLDLGVLIGKTPSVLTDSKGLFTLPGVPTNYRTELEVSHPEYLKLLEPAGLPPRPVKLKALKPTTMKGKLSAMYPSLASIPLAIKVEWYDGSNSNTLFPVNADGSFEVRGIRPDEQEGQRHGRATLCADPNSKLPEGIREVADPKYWPYASVLEVRKPYGRTLCFGLGSAPVYRSTKYRFELPVTSPVKVSGVLYGMDGKPDPTLEILYQDPVNVMPRSVGWRSIKPGADGRWSLYARAGKLNLAVQQNYRFITMRDFKSSALASHRDVVFDLSTLTPEEIQKPAGEYVTAHIRVVDRKGVAVPGPRIKVEGQGAGLSEGGCGFDGILDIGGRNGSTARLTSPFLKKPVIFKLQNADEWKTVTFDFDQPDVPTALELTRDTGIGFG